MVAHIHVLRNLAAWRPRGFVSRGHNRYGHPRETGSAAREARARSELRSAAARCVPRSAEVVDAAIREVCRLRGYRLFALNVRTNHVHCVLAGQGGTADQAMVGLKAWSTRRLRESGLFGPGDRVWTYHGSTRYLWSPVALRAAIDYVLGGQGEDIVPQLKPG